MSDDKLPDGCARAWHAIPREGSNLAFAAIMELMQDGKFMLVYHPVGSPKPVVERYDSIDVALRFANDALNRYAVIARKIAFAGTPNIKGSTA